MSALVHFVRTGSGKKLFVQKFKKFVALAGMKKVVSEDDFVAVKLHFGEGGTGNTVSPKLVRAVVDAVKKAGGRPFLTDTNTLYRGRRKNAVDHLELAAEHGYGL